MKRLIFSFLLLTLFVWGDDPFGSFENQAKEIVSKMTLDEKIGQMLLPTFDLLTNQQGQGAMAKAKAAWNDRNEEELWRILGFDAIEKYHLGNLLQAGGPITYSGEQQGNTQWQKLSRLAHLHYKGQVPLLLGNDAIHGDQHVPGRILFPHNIGLGATHNPKLVEQVAHHTMLNLLYSGFNWSFMPTVAIAHDYRWGRTFESFGSDKAVIRALSKSYVEGLQDWKSGKITGVLANAKHFIGDGDTKDGMDEGYSYASSSKDMWGRNGAGYEGALAANVGSLMASYSSFNDIPMHFGGDFTILEKVRTQGIDGHRLDGFVVSDFLGVSRAAYKYNLIHEKKLTYPEAIGKAINSGVDMFMIADGAYIDPFEMKKGVYFTHIKTVIAAIKTALKKKFVTQQRLDESVLRIVRTKLALESQKGSITVPTQVKDSLDAAQQSLVLLKNNKNLLPCDAKKIKHLFLLGEFDDIGVQNGGWTINWQGQEGNSYWEKGSESKQTAHASSLLDGVEKYMNEATIYKRSEAALQSDLSRVSSENSLAIIALGEFPYAEYMGDVDNGNPWYKRGVAFKENLYAPTEQAQFLGLNLSEPQQRAAQKLKEKGVPIVVVLFSGRPLVITEPLKISDAFIAAFLPGTSGGEALANALFGAYRFKSVKSTIDGKEYSSNTLPFAWPSSMEEVRNHKPTLFPAGYGLPE